MKKSSAIILGLLILATMRANGQNGEKSSQPADAPYDQSSWLELLAAVEGGGGLDSGSPKQPTAWGGAKLGFPVGSANPGTHDITLTLDLGYDRVRTANGFATELSAMLPVFRFPKPQKDEKKNYIRIYAEPGIGHSSAAFGGYGSAKLMVALFSDRRLDLNKLSPYVEFQRRFPFESPLRGDNRIVFGLMVALCNHCGLD